jgi:cell division septum initiation protein DivIVA
MIPPQELGKKTFNRAGRGYDPSEVEQYFTFLIGKYTEIYNQCQVYHKKLEIVSQRIREIQEREDDIQNKEETIGKTMMSSQEIHDKRIGEARETASEIISRAEEAADGILAEARERARSAFSAVDKKAGERIEHARKKSEELYLASRTRCAKLLGDFKKEISGQKERLSALVAAADSFSAALNETYRQQFDAVKSISAYTPVIDFEKLSDTRLFNMLMEEIKEDMAEIEAKNGGGEYEFEKEIALLRNLDFADSRIKEYQANPAGAAQAQDGAGSGNAEDDDVKVFAGGAAVNANTAAEPGIYGSSAPASVAVPANVASAVIDVIDKEDKKDNGDNGIEEIEEIEDEQPIATYDSDGYGYRNSADNGSGNRGEDKSAGGGDEYENGKDSGNGNENGNDEEESAGGILGFFKGFGRKKKKDVDDTSDIDDIYGEFDDDDDKVMSIFGGLDDDDEDDDD